MTNETRVTRGTRNVDRFITCMLIRTIGRGRLDRSAFQLNGEELARTLLLLAHYGGDGSPSGYCKRFLRKLWRNDRYDALPCEFVHEQVQEARLHRLQGRDQNQ